jgi:hypothetical protein
MPRKNGKDDDGLSGSVVRKDLLELHKAKYLSIKATAAVLIADKIRHLEERRLLDVKWAPERDDPAHALITGIPPRNRSLENLRTAERLAELLAEAAQEYSFPVE